MNDFDLNSKEKRIMEFDILDEKSYPDFLRLYNESFPENERRLYKSAEDVSRFVKEKGGKFKGFVYNDGSDLFLAFLTYWVFEGFIYIEHFAVDPQHRSKNIGRKMLAHLFNTVGENVLIEVEMPGSEPNADRRIEFYRKNGFRLREDINYVQPSYGPGQKGLRMMLVTHGDVKLRDTRDLREMLTEVYNVEKGI